MAPTRQVSRGGLAFTITEAGPAGGEKVLLLHGFPQHADSWDQLVPLLTAEGYRTVAMDQRGYSPGARPKGRRAYRMPELVADSVAVIDAVAPGGRVHVVGHDWGATVAWALAAAHPDRLHSLTALSVPHSGAILRAMVTSVQGLRFWYICFFQLPRLPEFLLRRHLYDVLQRSGQPPAAARRDSGSFTGPGALTAALNWYRAIPFVDPRASAEPVRTPTLLVWSDGDVAIDRHGAEACGGYVQAPYQFETLHGVSHWIPDEAPAQTAALLLPHLKRWSGSAV